MPEPVERKQVKRLNASASQLWRGSHGSNSLAPMD